MLLGIAIGFAVGILPGLGGPTAMALMLPFVIKMTPVEAFAFLLGMACVVNTTGDITSVLFGIPVNRQRQQPSSMDTPWRKKDRQAERLEQS